MLQAIRVLPKAPGLDQSNRIAKRILMRDRLAPLIVERQLEPVSDLGQRDCAMMDWTAMVLLSGWSSEYAHAQGLFEQADQRTQRALNIAEKAIQCAPTNGYAWMSIVRLTLVNEGFHDRQRRILDLTWQLMPYEAWVMLARAAIIVSSGIPDDRERRRRALDDLARLVEAEATRSVVAIIRGAGPQAQVELAERVAKLPYRIQRRYQAEAVAMGIDTTPLSIPPSSADPEWVKRHRDCQDNPRACP